MSRTLHGSAFIKIPKGKLERFKELAADCITQTMKHDKKAITYDWYISEDETECEIREEFESSEAIIEHIKNIRPALDALFAEFPTDHVNIYSDLSPKLLEMIKQMNVKVYTFFKGLK